APAGAFLRLPRRRRRARPLSPANHPPFYGCCGSAPAGELAGVGQVVWTFAWECGSLLLSMTGFGEARRQENDLTVAAEVRTVNSRYFKLSLRISDGYGTLEPEIESLVRERIKRGTVQVSLSVQRVARADDYQLNAAALES